MVAASRNILLIRNFGFYYTSLKYTYLVTNSRDYLGLEAALMKCSLYFFTEDKCMEPHAFAFSISSWSVPFKIDELPSRCAKLQADEYTFSPTKVPFASRDANIPIFCV